MHSQALCIQRHLFLCRQAHIIQPPKRYIGIRMLLLVLICLLRVIYDLFDFFAKLRMLKDRKPCNRRSRKSQMDPEFFSADNGRCIRIYIEAVLLTIYEFGMRKP